MATLSDFSKLLGTDKYGLNITLADDEIGVATELTLDTRLSSLETKLDTLLNSQDPINDKLNVQQSGTKASNAVTITPDNDIILATIPTAGVYIGGVGDIKVDMQGGSTTTLVGLKAGVVYPFKITKIYATDTTATDIVAVYDNILNFLILPIDSENFFRDGTLLATWEGYDAGTDVSQIDLVNADTSSVTDMGFMFYNADAFNQDIGAWDTSSVTTMRTMFYNADAFNQDISWNSANPLEWNVSSVTVFTEFLTLAPAFSVENYDKFLIGLKEQDDAGYTLNSGLVFDCASAYGTDPDAITAHDWLVNTKGWTINDGGLV